MEDRYKYRQNERKFSKKETTMDHNSQIPSTRCSRRLSKASAGSRFATRSSGCPHSTWSEKQVYLYNWSLIRVGEDHPENGTADNGIQVALEGSTTTDLLDNEKLRTAPIESRIEKCKLRTVDGMNILLMGVIDEQCSYENGFPLQVIHLFLTGFPFNWNHLLNTCFGQLSLNASVLPPSKEKESVWQEKDETQNSCCRETHMKNTGTGKSSLPEAELKISKVEEKLSKVISRESLARGSKRGRNGSQPIRSSKRLKYCNLSINSKPKVFIPFVGLVENSIHTASVKTERKDTTLDQLYLCTEDYKKVERDDQLTESDSKLLRKSLNFSVSQEDKDSVKTKENIVCNVSRTMKETRESVKQIDSGSFLDQTKLAQFVCPFTNESGGANQTNGFFASAEDSFYQRIDKSSTEIANNHPEGNDDEEGNMQTPKTGIEINMQTQTEKRQLVNNIPPTPLRHAHKTPEEVSKEFGLKPSKSGTKRRGRSMTRTGCTDQPPQPSEAFLCHQSNANDSVMLKCNDINATCGTTPYKVPSKIEHGMASDYCTEIGENCPKGNENGEGSMQTPKTGIEINMQTRTKKWQLVNNIPPTPLCHVHMTPEKVSKELGSKTSRPGTKRRGKPKTRTRCTDQPPQLSEAFLCHQTNVNDSVMLKCNDINATCGTTPDKGPSTIEHGTASGNCTEIGENCPKGNGNGEGSMQTPKTKCNGIEINLQTQTKKRQLLNNIPLSPLRRVHTTPEEVSKAFGLKTSRSGRLLVPPLAHWCNQTIAYDMDGGIIAILDASSQRDKHYGNSIFMPPKQKDAILIRKKLCNAATESNLTLRSAKKACKD